MCLGDFCWQPRELGVNSEGERYPGSILMDQIQEVFWVILAVTEGTPGLLRQGKWGQKQELEERLSHCERWSGYASRTERRLPEPKQHPEAPCCQRRGQDQHCLVLGPSLSPSTRDFTAMPCSFLKTRVCLLTDSTTVVVPHAVPPTHTFPYTPRPPLVTRALFSDLPLETHCGLGLFCCPHVP